MILKIAQFLGNLHREDKGFTLVELLVVMAILGVLAAIAIPLVANQIDAAREAANTANVRLLQGAADLFKLDTGVYPWGPNSPDANGNWDTVSAWQAFLTAESAADVDTLVGVGSTYFASDSDWSGPYLREAVLPPAGHLPYDINAALPVFTDSPPSQTGDGKVDNEVAATI